jgi:glycosyltransferase involved in cell wall biosynthesis
MKIIHIGSVAGLGGLETWVRGLAEAQARRGHRVEVMQPPWTRPDAEIFTQLPVLRWNPELADNFDIIHSHGTSGFHNRMIRRTSRKPIVHTYYGTILGIQIAMRWFQNLVGWNGRSVPLGIWYEISGGRSADAVIAISPKVASEVRKYYGVAGKKITVIPGGYRRQSEIESRDCLRRSLGFPESKFLFAFVSRQDPLKNPAAVFAALRIVQSRFPQAALVAAPKQEVPADLDIVTLDVPPHKMNRLYRAANALIHPSVYDAYALSVHEAMANGLPVIVSSGTGAAYYCADRTDALILKEVRGPKLVNAIAEAMFALLESAELCARLGHEAERKFAPMDWEWVEAETAKVYGRI